MKRRDIFLVVVLAVVLFGSNLNAQKISIYANNLFLIPIGKTETVYSNSQSGKMKPILSKGGQIGIDYELSNKIYLGLGLGLEDFNFLQLPNKKNKYGMTTVSLGGNGSAPRIFLYNVYAKLSYKFSISERSNLNISLAPILAYFDGDRISDTAILNKPYREFLNSNGFYYVDKYDISHKYNGGLKFLTAVSLEYELALGKRKMFSLLGSGLYQQGYSVFYEYTGFSGVQAESEGIYRTSLRGTSFKFCLGVKLYLGLRSKVRMLGQFS